MAPYWYSVFELYTSAEILVPDVEREVESLTVAVRIRLSVLGQSWRLIIHVVARTGAVAWARIAIVRCTVERTGRVGQPGRSHDRMGVRIDTGEIVAGRRELPSLTP